MLESRNVLIFLGVFSAIFVIFRLGPHKRVRLRSTAVRRTRSLLSLVGSNERTNERSERVRLTAVERSRTLLYCWNWWNRPISWRMIPRRRAQRQLYFLPYGRTKRRQEYHQFGANQRFKEKERIRTWNSSRYTTVMPKEIIIMIRFIIL